MNSFCFFVYHLLWHLGIILGETLHRWFPFKLRKYFEERRWPQIVWRVNPSPDQRRIWFHAASGELEYIKPILREWKKRFPEDLLFVTYFSTSARSLIAQVPEIDGWAPLPYDLPSYCERFVRALNPAILLIARTDLWPTLLKTLEQKPKILLASTWAEGSKKTKGLGRLMSHWNLKYLNKVCVVSQNDAEWLKRFAPSVEVTVTGDPRFDQVQFRLEQQRPLPPKILEWRGNAFTVVAGSTWTEDEEVLLLAWKKAQLPEARLLLIPHEATPLHLAELKRQLKRERLKYALWSQIQSSPEAIEAPVLIFDQKGWLAELYQLGHLAFIGGSFRQQVHSVMEALGCGLPVVVGPFFKNNREAIEFSELGAQGSPFVETVTNSDSLAQILKKHSAQEEPWATTLRVEVKKAFHERCHAAPKTMQEILQWL